MRKAGAPGFGGAVEPSLTGPPGGGAGTDRTVLRGRPSPVGRRCQPATAGGGRCRASGSRAVHGRPRVV
jgi:hypothetical protein